MPPVFGPVSPSPTCLWSWTGSRIRIVLPSVMAKTLASSPSRNSSTRMRLPASPWRRSSMTWSMAVLADLTSNSLEPTFEASRYAPSAFGPKTGMSHARKRSPSPMHRGSSGPITTSPTPSVRARVTMPSRSVAFTPALRATKAVPALPGAQITSSTRGDWAIFQQRACSRPPEPTTRTFMMSEGGQRAPDPGARAAQGTVADAIARVRRANPSGSRRTSGPATLWAIGEYLSW